LYRAKVQVLTVLDGIGRDVKSRAVRILSVILVNNGLGFIISDSKGFLGQGVTFLLEIILQKGRSESVIIFKIKNLINVSGA